MSEKKSPLNNLSPDVSALLGGRDPQTQEKPRRRKSKGPEKKRPTITVDMPEWIQGEVRELMDKEDIGLSGAINWLTLEGLKAYKAGAVIEKTGARSLKFAYAPKLENKASNEQS